MDNKLKDTRFEFLVEMGFDIYEINRQIELWNESTIDSAGDLYLKEVYIENISTLLGKYNDQRFVLYMFFLYSYSFAIANKFFSERLNIIEDILGEDYLNKIDDDFWNSGESKIFAYIGVATSDDEWRRKMEKLAREINLTSDEDDELDCKSEEQPVDNEKEKIKSKFDEIADYIITTKREWLHGNAVNKRITFAIFKMFDLADLLEVDLNAEMESTSENILNACDYVKDRIQEEISKRDDDNE